MRIELLDEQIHREIIKAIFGSVGYGESPFATALRKAMETFSGELNSLVSTTLHGILSDPDFRARLSAGLSAAMMQAAAAKVASTVKAVPRSEIKGLLDLAQR